MDVIIEGEKNLECSGVYVIRNNVNNMVYIGRAKNVYKRAIQHRLNLKRGRCNKKFIEFLQNNPDVVFRVCLLERTEDLKNREEFYIEKLNTVERGFNMLHKDDDFIKFVFPRKQKLIKPPKAQTIKEFVIFLAKKRRNRIGASR